MKRRILIALLALGTVGGYAAGFASLRRCGQARREYFERHVAELCVDAAKRDGNAAAAPQPQAVPAVQVVLPGVQVVPAAQAPAAPQPPVAPAAPAAAP